MNLNNLKNVQVSSIHGRDLFLPRKFDIDTAIYIEAVDGFVTALFDYMRRRWKYERFRPEESL